MEITIFVNVIYNSCLRVVIQSTLQYRPRDGDDSSRIQCNWLGSSMKSSWSTSGFRSPSQVMSQCSQSFVAFRACVIAHAIEVGMKGRFLVGDA